MKNIFETLENNKFSYSEIKDKSTIALLDEEEYDMGDKQGTSKNLSTMSLGSNLSGLGGLKMENLPV